MIIGTFYLDGTTPEPVDISTKGRFFEVEACIVRHPRRYPTYKVDYCSLAFCETFEVAEKVMKEILASGQIITKDLYCLYIYERVFDVAYDRNEYSKCWLYDDKGKMIDKRLFPSYWSEDGFVGRSEDEIRFKWGKSLKLRFTSMLLHSTISRQLPWGISAVESAGKKSTSLWTIPTPKTFLLR